VTSELWTWTATDVAAAVRAGELSPTETVDSALARIDALDERIGAFQTVRRDRARDEALLLQANPVDLPLAGVPVAIKDNVDVAGEPTRDGSLATSPLPKDDDHEVVRRIKAAGAIVVGKTRVPELCVFGVTDSPFGITRNPWNAERTPGGSSGGSAAAAAAGMVPLAHGNDGMGSIRIPAACCGLFGIKAGFGVVPAGIGASDWRGLAENGPLATTVTDAALLLSVMADRPELAEPRPPDRPLQIAVSVNSPGAALGATADREWKRAAREAGEILSTAGHHVEETKVPYATKFATAAIWWWTAGTDDDAEQVDRSKLQASIRRHASIGGWVKRRKLAKPECRDEWRARLKPFFERFDVVVTPSLARAPVEARRWGERGWLANVRQSSRFAPFQNAWNLAGYPAASVPFGGLHSAGTPLGVQLVAPEGGEALLLSVARQLEELRPWPRHAPMASA
jgi:amidase